MEEFRTIPGFEDYEVSNFGRIKTKSRQVRYEHAITREEHFRKTEGRYLKEYYNKRTGYKFVQPRRNKKPSNKNIHQLVAITFLPNPLNYPVVNHKDGNKHNNMVENLEWCSNEYNHYHATKTGLMARGSRVGTSKLNERSVIAIKNMLHDGVSHTTIAGWFNISRAAISLIAENKTWKYALCGEELTIKEK